MGAAGNNLGAVRRRAAEREAELQERLSLMRKALRDTLAVFDTFRETHGRRTQLAKLPASELVALIRAAQRTGYAALDGKTFAELDEPEVITDHSPLAALHLELRLLNHLEKAGYRTIADVLAAPHYWIEQLSNVGPRALASLRQRLAEHGFEWHEQGAGAVTVPSD